MTRHFTARSGVAELARTRQPGKWVVAIVLALMLALASSPAFASGDCDAINAYWGGGRTIGTPNANVSDEKDYQGPFEAGEVLTYSASTSGTKGTNYNSVSVWDGTYSAGFEASDAASPITDSNLTYPLETDSVIYISQGAYNENGGNVVLTLKVSCAGAPVAPVAPCSLTVANGNFGVISDANCPFSPDSWGFIDPPGPGNPAVSPTHGTVLIDVVQNTATYTHNGDAATEDDFVFLDAEHTPIAVHVTILPAVSAITVAPASLSVPVVGTPYSQTLTASGGIAPYTWGAVSGSLPPGLSLNPGGLISGTPTGAGPYSFTVPVTDSTVPTALTGSKGYSLTIADPVLVVAPASAPNGTVGQSYSQQYSTTGGIAPYDYRVEVNVGTGPPPGLTMSSAGLLSGTPTTAGTYSFSLISDDVSTNSNGGNFYAVKSVSITIDPAPPPPVAGAVSASVAYGSSANPITPSLSGGAATAVQVATAPAHGTASASGTSLTYTPTAGYAGPDSFTYTASNAGGTSSPASVSITVGVPTLALAPVGGTALSGTAGTAFSQSFTGSGGTGPYSYALTLTSGSIPTGMSFSAGTGVLSGTPTLSGTAGFTVTATDASTGSGPFSTTSAYSLTIGAPAISVGPMILPAPAVGVAYTPQTVTASGGVAPYTFDIASGALPAGMALSGDIVSGTPTEAGSFTVEIRATDSDLNTGRSFYSFLIAGPSIAIGAASLPGGIAGTAYAPQTVTATGGTAPYTYGISAGALPLGLTINASSGVISGIPTASSIYNFAVTATDSTTGTGAPFSGSQAYTITTTSGAPTAGPVTAAVAYGSSANAIALDLGGGSVTTVAISSPAVHGTATASGVSITYTPAVGYFGPDSFAYTATGPGGTSGPATVSVTVAPPAAPVAAAASASVAHDTARIIDLSGSITGVHTGIAIAAAPAHGTTSVAGDVVTIRQRRGIRVLTASPIRLQVRAAPPLRRP